MEFYLGLLFKNSNADYLYQYHYSNTLKKRLKHEKKDYKGLFRKIKSKDLYNGLK
jgi:hypothetical protein